MSRRPRGLVLPCLALIGVVAAWGQETLYNGIQLPAEWPPIRTPTQIPSVPTYLTSPPPVIIIDKGRQLFVDNFLVENTSLVRTPHRPVLYARNPILASTPGVWPDFSYWAFPYSDGVWFDPADNLFKMWYLGNNAASISYAYSTDGVNWIKPALTGNVLPGSNRVLDTGGGRDSITVWMDLEDPNPQRKFKAFVYASGARLNWFTSPNGINWTQQPNQILTLNDRTTFFWNPFRQRWINNIRGHTTLPAGNTRPLISGARSRYYAETTDLLNYNPSNPSTAWWLAADEDDPIYFGPGGQPPQMYHLDAVAYESVMLGMFSFLHPGPEEDPDFLPGPNLVEMGVGFSRDGFQWERPTRGFGPAAFIPAANKPEAWDGYNSQSAGGCVLVVGDQLWFYFSGRSLPHYMPWGITPSATGLAILRRDGFYSMDAGATEGVLTTRPVRFNGNRLFVNVKNPSGSLKVEILNQNGDVISPFTKTNSISVNADKTLIEMKWQGVTDLSSLAGTPVKFRFSLTNGELYAFWVTPNANGASFGYVGAGGPGFSGPTDTVGNQGATGGLDIEPPTVTITNPTSDQTITGVINLSASVSDNVGVERVQFKIDGQNFGSELTGPPFQVSVDTTTLTQGPHVFSATARDAEFNSGVSADVTANVSHGVPAVLSGGQPAGVLPTTTTQAVLRVNTNKAATCRYATSPSTPYTAMTLQFSSTGGSVHTVNITGLTPATSHTFYVRCDASGAFNLTDYVVAFSIAPDTEAPLVTITSPTGGQTVSGVVSVSATVTDNIGVAAVQFLVDGNPLGDPDLSPPYVATWNTPSFSNGNHVLSVSATDAAGNPRVVSVTVNLSNVALDSAPPVLSDGAPTGALPVGTVQTTISLSTNEAAVCRYSSTPGVAFADMSGTFSTTGNLSHSTQVPGLVNGTTYNFYVRCRDTLLNSNTTDYTISFSVASPAPVFTQYVEAETGRLVPSMRKVVDTISYIRAVENGQGSATYYITIPFDTTLRIFGRVWSPQLGYGSYNVSMDGGPEELWAIGQQISASATWEWLPVGGTAAARLFPVTAGTHTFTFRGGALNTYLDTLAFTSDLAFLPAAIPPDGVAPERSNPLPLGALPAGTSSATVSLVTNEFATCRFSVNGGLSYDAMENVFSVTGGTTHNFTMSGLTDGTHYGYLTRCQDAAGNANTQDYPLYFSVASPGQPAGAYSQYFEAEWGAIVSPMFVTLDPQASAGKFIRSSQGNQGTATHLIVLPAAGSYTLSGRVLMPAALPASFNISVDGGPEALWNAGVSTSWNWRQVTNADGTPRVFTLAAGAHTIVIRAGLGNTYLDRLQISNDGLPPSEPDPLVASNGTPSGVLASSTTQATMGVSTNRAATCRYATTQGLAFASMTGIFTATGGTSHSVLLTSLTGGTSYTFYIRCNDGTVTSAEIAVQFSIADGVKPTVAIGPPTPLQTVSGTIGITATADDNVGVTGVQLLLNGNPVGSPDTVAPYVFQWDTTGVANGDHVLTVVATDAAGNSESASVTVNVANTDTVKPTVAIGPPSPLQTVSGTIGITATADDNVGVTGVQLLLNGNPVGSPDTVAPYVFQWDTTGVANGDHVLTVVATDAAGNSESASVTVNVANVALDVAPPTLSSGAPTGTLPAGTTQAQLAVTTNEAAVCRYSTTAGVSFASMTSTFTSTGGTSHSTQVSGLAGGVAYSFYVRCRDSALNANLADYVIGFSVASSASQGGTFTQYVEAESGVPILPMRKVLDTGIQFIRTTQTNFGTASYAITLPTPATVAMFGLVWAPQINYGSFYVSVDDGPEEFWNLGQQITTGYTWQWHPLRVGGALRTFSLAAGTHTFRIRGGASNTGLDRLVFTTDLALQPSNTSPVDTIPPVLSNPQPTAALPAGTTSAGLSLTTNEFATCRYSVNAGLLYEAMESVFTLTGGTAHSVTVNNLVNGTSYGILVRCQDAMANPNTSDFPIYFSVARPGQPAGLYEQYFEAESGVITSPMFVTLGDSQASGGKFIRASLSNAGTATYQLTVPAAGSYRLWGRVYTPGSLPATFYVSVDGGPEELWDGGINRPWNWKPVNDASGLPRVFPLGPGTHTIVVRTANANIYLDELLLTNDASLTPQ